MFKILLVGIGGFVGSVLRYAMSGLTHRLLAKAWFPWGTLAVNVLGCFLIGLLSGLTDSRQVLNSEARVFIFIGVLGGFTTFSSFGYEVFSLARDGQMLASFSNIAMNVVFGLTAVYSGHIISRFI